jgi:hypothetical protein
MLRRGRLPRSAWILLPALAGGAAAQTLRPRTYANPIDIDYRYNFEQLNERISYRSGADPVIVVQRGRYYLFETLGDGYWESTDLGTWRHITPTRWPINDIVAPAVLSVRDTIYVLPSTTSPLPILMLTQPATGRVEFYNRLLPWLPMARAGGRLTREAGLRPARPVGSAVLPRSGYGAVVPVLELVECVSAARDRARQGEASRLQGNPEVALRPRA